MLNVSYTKQNSYIDNCLIALDVVAETYLDDFWVNLISLDGSFGLSVGETNARQTAFKRSLAESVPLKETDSLKAEIAKGEDFSVGESVSKASGIGWSEKATIAEKSIKNFNLLKDEALLNGSLMRSQNLFDRFIKEICTAQEGAFKSVYKALSDKAASKDAKMTKTVKNLFEEVDGVENLERVAKFKREFAEKITGAEIGKRTYNLFEKESDLSINCYRVLPNPCGVLSDIRVQDHGLTLADFNSEIERPSGYNTFSEFKVGEYEYQDAMYRLTIKKSNIAANPLVYDYKIHVDIDDVKDRGTADIPAEETKVYFNRQYYTDPEVVVNVISGTEGKVIIPFITDTSGEDDRGRYFKVVLKDTTGAIVAGTISWNSNGY